MTRSFFILPGIFLLWLVSCTQDNIEPLMIPDEVMPFIESFEEEAALRGIPLTIDELIVEFGTDLESNSGVDAAGQCIVSNRRNSIPRIVLDTTSFTWQNNESSREFLVFHELGHCILDRLQHRDDQLTNGNFASIMLTTSTQLYGPKLNGFKREYYIDELFDQSTGEPDWASDIPDFNSLVATRSPIFLDEFDNNANGWPILSNENAEGRISNGEFYFESKQDQAFLASTLVALNQDQDYEIETTIKIESGENLALLEWGGSRTNDFYFMGFSSDGTFFSGQWETGFSSIIELTNFRGNDFNKLTIRKLGQFYYIYVNEKFVDIYEAEPLPGFLMAYYVGGQTALSADYLRVNLLQ